MNLYEVNILGMMGVGKNQNCKIITDLGVVYDGKITDITVPGDFAFSRDVSVSVELIGPHRRTDPSTVGVKTGIEKVIFNDPATIVFWRDGTKTVVKTQNGETFDPEKGLMAAITKKALGNQGNYYNVIDEWVGKYKIEQPAVQADSIADPIKRAGVCAAEASKNLAKAFEKINKDLKKKGRGL